jgi:pimeloyl-ACP methyl ester carboxylesterase
MYLAEFAQTSRPQSLAGTRYYEECLLTAADFGRPARGPVLCVSRNVIVNGLRLHMLDWGTDRPDRPAILLLHGGAVSARGWGPCAAMLGHAYRLIALDMRGHGDSEWPRDGLATHDMMADDLRGLIAELRLDRPAIVGHSVGGLLLMRLMVHSPGLLRGAMLVDVGPETEYQGWQPRTEVSEVRGRLYDDLEEFVSRNASRLNRTEQQVRRYAHHEFMQRADGRFQPKYDPRHPMGGPEPATMPGLPGLADLAGVDLPVALVRGGDSWFLTQEAAERLAQTLPGCRFDVVPGTQHLVYEENPRAMAELIERFVESLAC